MYILKLRHFYHYLSLYGSVRLIDVISEEDIYNEVYEKMEKYIKSI